jgi:hypothetical protein
MGRMFGGSQGRPLESGLREEMESGFGADFSGVRVHTGSEGQRAARALNATAATYGGDIVFARGAYNPSSADGRRLVAHELAHVVQQSDGRGPAPSPHPNGPTETDAASAASAVVAGGRASVHTRTAPSIARQAAAPAKTPNVVGRDEAETLQNALAVLDSIKQVGSNAYEVTLDGQTRHLTQADVDAAFSKTKAALRRSLTSIRIKAEGAVEGYNAQSDVDAEHPIISRAVKFFGSIEDPGDEIRGLAVRAFNLIIASQVQLENNHFANAGRLMSIAEMLAKRAEKIYHNYHEDIISTAETTVTVLEYTQTAAFVTLAVLATVATSVAAAGVTSVAGVELGAASTANAIALWTPVAAKLGQAGVKIAYGEKVDWKELAVDIVVTAVVAKFAPQLSEGIAARIIGSNPAAATLGRKAVASIVSGLITGRGSAAFGAAAHTACQKYEGKDVTWGDLVNATTDAVLDPKSAGLDLVLGAIGTAGAVKGASGTGGAHEPSPTHTGAPAPKRAAKTAPAPKPAAKAPEHAAPPVPKPVPHEPAAAPKAAKPPAEPLRVIQGGGEGDQIPRGRLREVGEHGEIIEPKSAAPPKKAAEAQIPVERQQHEEIPIKKAANAPDFTPSGPSMRKTGPEITASTGPRQPSQGPTPRPVVNQPAPVAPSGPRSVARPPEQVTVPAPKTVAEPAAPKGPVVEETRIKPTVVRRRRAPGEPGAPVPEKKPAGPESKPLTAAQRKANMAAEAREEMRGHSEHERENASEENVPRDIDEVRDKPNLREDEMHSPTHPDILAAALEKAGMPRRPGDEPHHIVPTKGGGEAGERARAVIERAGIGGDEADNGVWLPRTTMDPRTVPQTAPIDPRIAPEGLSRHQTIHTKRYYEELARRLEAAEGKRSIRDTLRDIRTEISDGKFPH